MFEPGPAPWTDDLRRLGGDRRAWRPLGHRCEPSRETIRRTTLSTSLIVPTVLRGPGTGGRWRSASAGGRCSIRSTLGLLRLADPAPAVGADLLQEAVHPLGVEGSAGQRRLARSGHADDHDRPPQRHIHVEVAQVVVAHAAHFDGGAAARPGSAAAPPPGAGDDAGQLRAGSSSVTAGMTCSPYAASVCVLVVVLQVDRELVDAERRAARSSRSMCCLRPGRGCRTGRRSRRARTSVWVLPARPCSL